MRNFKYVMDGKETIYYGWNRRITVDTKHIALIRDDDVIDILAIDNPSKLDGVMAYVDDNPRTELLGVWKLHKPVTRETTLERLRQIQQDNADDNPAVYVAIRQLLALTPRQFEELVKILT